MFDEHHIARHQMRTGKASQLIIRVDPGLNAEQHAEGRIFKKSVASARVELLRRKERFGFIREVLQDGSAQLHLSSALRDSLSHFQCGEASEFFLLFEK